MKKIFCFFIFLSLLGFNSFATAAKVHINFDDLTAGDHLTDQYLEQGVIFSGTWADNIGDAGIVGIEGDYGTFGFGNSEPNFVIVGLGSITAKFIDPITGAPKKVSNLSVRIGDGDLDPEGIGINAFDVDGNLIYSSIVHLIEKGTTVSIQTGGIAEVRIFNVPIFSEGGGIGFAIDDFEFNSKKHPSK